MSRRWWLWAAVAALIVVAFFVGCTPGSPGSDPQPAGSRSSGAQNTSVPTSGDRNQAAIPVQVVVVESGSLTTTHVTTGTVQPVTQSEVAAQVAGVVSRIVHLAGDTVAAGETVVQLDDAQFRLQEQIAQAALESARINLTVSQETTQESNPTLVAQLESAQSALAAAQKTYDAQQALYKLGGTSASQLDSARSQLDQARANAQSAQAALERNQKADTQSLAQLRLAVDQASNQLELARLNLRNAAVKAPFAGQIAAVHVSPGVYVSQNTAAFLLVGRERQVSFSVPPADAAGLSLGTAMTLSFQGRSLPLQVSQAPSVPIAGTVPMVAAVPASAAPAAGTVGTLSYPITLAHGVIIPLEALQSNASQYTVFTVLDGKVAVQPITIVAETGTSAAVTGLTAGVQVIVNPPPGLLPGSSVQPVASVAQGRGK